MRIRCERCATTYELDERRLPPHGALVKCTRCDHVFRAAPPGATPHETEPSATTAPARAQGAPADDQTALFGFASPAAEERTASIGSAPPPAPEGARRAAPPPVVRQPGRAGQGGQGPVAAPRRARWPWVLLAALLAAAVIAGGWYLAQRSAATPTTRLPAGAELFPI